MSWLFSRVLVEVYSEVDYWDGEPFARSSSIHTPQAFWPNDRTTEFSRPSRSGMTFGHSTGIPGEDLLTWFLEDSRARTYQPPEREKGLTESGQDSGKRWQGSFAKYDPDSSSWKTPLSLLGEGFTEYSGTWPRWGMMLDGECWAQSIPAYLIRENVSGLLPTPEASSHKIAGSIPYLERRRSIGKQLGITGHLALESGGGKANPQFLELMMGWPISWTELDALAMGKYQQWLRSHSDSCQE